ncbi:N-acetylmuramoyl-L-alanine amidase [Bacillus sp. V3B]|uniref:N-acetylmuramoyl-L-alanine amidase n=1 Tax=Bacillus sp. V3B TaxID=2804915 RepID=UPI00210E4C67|nr:N-acetylmuramoyl-L-alanine amidase [Bacillus sp. V3B]MCQ6276199.1 N-acetylmuramoyl-L-alanine amidase [Bacillus sp. V3B]
MVKIFIDPGHGGADPGATANGLQEKNITLTIATHIQKMLTSEYNNVSIRMSRTEDQTVSLSARTNAANNWGADVYLSVHINAGGGTGFESFVYPGVGRPTVTYQENIHKKILEQVQYTNRGLKQAGYHVLRESNMPAVLTENGFIDHRVDASKLKESSFLESLARGHVNGIAAAFRLTKKAATPPSEPPTNGLFRVQIGAFRNKTNVDQLVSRANAKGFQTYLRQEGNLYKVQIGAFSERENADELMNRAKAAGFDATIIIN